MTTRTETTQETTELIRSVDYNTGWSYAVSGTGVESSTGDICDSQSSPSDRLELTSWMDTTQHEQQAFVEADNSRGSTASSSPTRAWRFQRDDDRQKSDSKKHYRYQSIFQR